MINYLPKKNKRLIAWGFKDPITQESKIPEFLGTQKAFQRCKKYPTQSGRTQKMKAKVEKAIKIDDGKYEGVITSTELKTSKQGYEYFDIHIKENKTEFELKCGVPFSITENTSLGQMLMNFGAKLEEGNEIDTDDYLKEGVKVSFMIINNKTDKGTFANIQALSLKPVK